MPSVFMQNAIAVVEETYTSGNWAAASGRIFQLLAILITLYIISLIAGKITGKKHSDIFFGFLHYLLPPFLAASWCSEGAEIHPVKD